MSDCDDITFYSPSDTFGGNKPVDHCIPGKKRIAPELRDPEEIFEEVPKPKTPGPISVWNESVTKSCSAEYGEGAMGEASIVVAGTYREDVLIPVVITVGDDTTLISSDILYRFDIPVIGITDGDLDKVVEDGFKVKNSIIFEVESGFDDIIGQNIQKEIFNGNHESEEFENIDEVKDKIIEIINNINCKYKINYIK